MMDFSLFFFYAFDTWNIVVLPHLLSFLPPPPPPSDRYDLVSKDNKQYASFCFLLFVQILSNLFGLYLICSTSKLLRGIACWRPPRVTLAVARVVLYHAAHKEDDEHGQQPVDQHGEHGHPGVVLDDDAVDAVAAHEQDVGVPVAVQVGKDGVVDGRALVDHGQRRDSVAQRVHEQEGGPAQHDDKDGLRLEYKSKLFNNRTTRILFYYIFLL